jgi:hypothetical protein
MICQWETARFAHFLRFEKGHSKRAGTSPRMIWRDAPAVTTEGDEVKISASVTAPQGLRIEEIMRTLQNQRVRHPPSALPTYSESNANDILLTRLMGERISEYNPVRRPPEAVIVYLKNRM